MEWTFRRCTGSTKFLRIFPLGKGVAEFCSACHCPFSHCDAGASAPFGMRAVGEPTVNRRKNSGGR